MDRNEENKKNAQTNGKLKNIKSDKLISIEISLDLVGSKGIAFIITDS